LADTNRDVFRDAVRRAVGEGTPVSLSQYDPPDGACGDLLEYCLFLKPELLAATADLDAILDIVFGVLPEDRQIVGEAVLPGSYLRRHDLMAQHYGAINRVSRMGRKALTEDTLARAAAEYGYRSIDEATILGAHEFLEAFPSFTAASLCQLHDSSDSKRIAGGTYVIRATVEGSPVIVLNGFHPVQLEMYYRDDAAILVFALRQRGSWVQLRQEMTGSTDPRRALPGSIRGLLYARQAELGLDGISSLRNGVHVSAGPVEGMAELVRYFTNWDDAKTIAMADTCFGAAAVAEVGEAAASQAASNPIVVHRQKAEPLFDLTEETDPPEALAVLAEVRDQLRG
jgi:hypothetical protein